MKYLPLFSLKNEKKKNLSLSSATVLKGAYGLIFDMVDTYISPFRNHRVASTSDFRS